ncbi:MAG: ABC transporter ATP-binding protein [Terriglobales bacterium]
MAELLAIRDLTVSYGVLQSPCTALRGVTLSLAEGGTLGVLGESGSGKSTLALSVIGLLPASAQVSSGAVIFRGDDLLRFPERQMQSLRGGAIALVPQEPAQALHPMLTAGEQIADVVRAHGLLSRRECRQQAEQMLREAGLEDVARIYRAYPHQLSGGQRQRVAIAQALCCRPALVIADEPTTALDVSTQREILDLLRRLQSEFGTALVLISHDPAVLENLVEQVIVLRNGEIVDRGAAATVLRAPTHTYTQALLDSRPRLEAFKHAG